LEEFKEEEEFLYQMPAMSVPQLKRKLSNEIQNIDNTGLIRSIKDGETLRKSTL
jgi:hypothetical protein